MTKLMRFLFLWVTLGICSWVGPASAQTISMPNTAFEIEREARRLDEERPLDISRQDCLESSAVGWNPNDGSRASDRAGNTWIVMEPRIDGIANSTRDFIEVWVSETADCTSTTARDDNQQCWIVYRTDHVDRNNTLIINPRDVIAANKGTTTYAYEQSRPESICTNPTNLIQRTLTFYILYRSSADSVDASFSWTQTAQDLAAPPPPDNVSVGPGDENLFFEWDIESTNEDVDTLGFVFYCIPSGTMRTIEDPVDAGTGGVGTGGVGTGGDGSSSGGDSATGGASSGGEASTGGMGGAPALTCNQDVISDGEFAAAEAVDYECGKVLGRSARRGQADDVENNVTYAVGVAAIDNVGNSGQLKVFDECLTPQEVTTFFEGYEESGGKGGGGFCALTPRNTNPLWWLLSLAGAAFFLRRKQAA